MESNHFQRVMSIFERACDLPRGERTAFIERECAGDEALRREVTGLLEHDERTEHLSGIETIRGGIRAIATELVKDQHIGLPAAAAAMPTSIGGYKIIRKIGEGGMGAVFEAEQQNPRRTVALKVIKSNLASPKMLRRFEYEAQVLGRLAHPGIAQIYEAGTAPTPEGGVQAYFAMEYVHGGQLDKYAAAKKLDIRSRLDLLARVCDAVQYAHQKGVIHRDLKPANILVVDEIVGTDERGIVGMWEGGNEGPTERGAGSPDENWSRASAQTGKPSGASMIPPSHIPAFPPSPVPAFPHSHAAQPKILDFGVARTTDPDHDLTTIHTGIGQLIGTLSYMSPEQLTGDPREVDTRSDVYALGVLGHQLLSGTLPHDIRSCSIPEAVRRILDNAPPRLGTLNRALRGDVEAIIAKALEKDRNRRYQTAADLASDIRRYIAGEPIEVKRDSTLYVFRKNLRRYRNLVAALVVIFMLVFGFGVVSFVQARRNRELAENADRAREQTAESLRTAQIEKRRADDTSDRLREEKLRADATADQLRDELIISNIEQGRLFGRTGNILAAEDMLWREHLQNPESPLSRWALWELYAAQPMLAAIPFAGASTAMEFTPDNREIVVGCKDGSVQFIDTTTWRSRRSILAHSEFVVALSLTHDGRRLATASTNGEVKVWDAATGTELFRRQSPRTGAACLDFSADGRELVTVLRGDGVIRTYEVPSGRPILALRRPGYWCANAAFSPDGRFIAAAVLDRTVAIWRNEPGYPDPVQVLAIGDEPTPVAFSADGRMVFVGTRDRVVQAWDLATGERRAIWSSPNGHVSRVALSPDGHSVFSGGYWSVDEWEIATGRKVRSMPLREGVTSMSISPDARLVATGGPTGLFVRERQTPGYAEFGPFPARAAAAFSPDGKYVAAGDLSGDVRVWDAVAGRLCYEVKAHLYRIYDLRFDHAGKRLATTCSGERAVHVRDAASGECLLRIDQTRNQTCSSVAWSPDDQVIAACMADNSVALLDSATGAELFRLPAKGEILSVAFSPDGRTIATTSRPFNLRLWSRTGELVGEYNTTLRPVWTVTWSADGRYTAMGTWARGIEVVDTATGEMDSFLTGHNGTVWAVQFHPTEPNILVSGAADGMIKIWDISLRRCLATLDVFEGWDILSLSFTADGRRLVSGSASGEISAWDIPYFDRHIAGNVEYHISRQSDALGDRIQATRLREWAGAVAKRPRESPLAGNGHSRREARRQVQSLSDPLQHSQSNE